MANAFLAVLCAFLALAEAVSLRYSAPGGLLGWTSEPPAKHLPWIKAASDVANIREKITKLIDSDWGTTGACCGDCSLSCWHVVEKMTDMYQTPRHELLNYYLEGMQHWTKAMGEYDSVASFFQKNARSYPDLNGKIVHPGHDAMHPFLINKTIEDAKLIETAWLKETYNLTKQASKLLDLDWQTPACDSCQERVPTAGLVSYRELQDWSHLSCEMLGLFGAAYLSGPDEAFDVANCRAWACVPDKDAHKIAASCAEVHRESWEWPSRFAPEEKEGYPAMELTPEGTFKLI